MDVTATNQYSLADRTEQLLNDLDHDIEVIAFYKGEVSLGPQGSASAAYQLLNRESKVVETFREFEAARPTKFHSSFVDPDVNPQRVNQYFGTTPIAFVNESIVVKLKDGDALDVIQPKDAEYSHLEQDLVTSILVVTGQEQKAIYFLAGHGERSIAEGRFRRLQRRPHRPRTGQLPSWKPCGGIPATRTSLSRTMPPCWWWRAPPMNCPTPTRKS